MTLSTKGQRVRLVVVRPPQVKWDRVVHLVGCGEHLRAMPTSPGLTCGHDLLLVDREAARLYHQNSSARVAG